VVLCVASVFVGCQINLISLEWLVRDPVGKEYGNALTFLQFAAVSLLSLCYMFDSSARWCVAPRHLSGHYVVVLATLFYAVSVLNNVVFAFDISIPLHSIFRSSSLIVSMVIGFLIRGTRYSPAQITCALLVSVGVCALTIVSAGRKAGVDSHPSDLWWWVGVAVLASTTAASAAMGIVQESMYADAGRRYGDELRKTLWRESMFYSHALPIPVFIAVNFLSASPAVGGGLLQQVASTPPRLYGTLALNVASQFVCVRGVYALVANTSSFTMTLTLTLRKFASLMVSIVLFAHYESFTWVHWLSVTAVLTGGSCYPFVASASKAKKHVD
jgi:UDP-xylose/UDP-N-acetylglucosamine transporter B4